MCHLLGFYIFEFIVVLTMKMTVFLWCGTVYFGTNLLTFRSNCPEDGHCQIPTNVSKFLPDYPVLHPRRR